MDGHPAAAREVLWVDVRGSDQRIRMDLAEHPTDLTPKFGSCAPATENLVSESRSSAFYGTTQARRTQAFVQQAGAL